MTTKFTRHTFVPVVVALAASFVVIAVVACNGILGNEKLTADAGAPEPAPAPDAGPSEKCPGKKYCSAIDSCGPKDDRSFGCASEACEPCNVPNATAMCGPMGCTAKDCFPGVLRVHTGYVRRPLGGEELRQVWRPLPYLDAVLCAFAAGGGAPVHLFGHVSAAADGLRVLRSLLRSHEVHGSLRQV